MQPLIICAAPYGPQWLPGDTTDLPVTWDEQVQAAKDCYNAGNADGGGRGADQQDPNSFFVTPKASIRAFENAKEVFIRSPTYRSASDTQNRRLQPRTPGLHDSGAVTILCYDPVRAGQITANWRIQKRTQARDATDTDRHLRPQ
jgi:hypothetical protein